MGLRRIALFLAVAILPPAASLPQESESPGLGTLSLEELMNTRVVSASNTSEALGEAPATVIVVTRDDIRERGYTEMSEVLDDLPGMQVIRAYGDTYFKDYWRGFRNTIGDPFLVMVDGVILNHLYFNTADVLSTLPLSNVERIEVVYGPASAVYGPNAFMGVINVITVQDKPPGAHQDLRLTAGSQDARVADMQLFFQTGELRLSLSGRFDNGDLDRASGERYEYTRERYYSDRRLWGGFVDNPKLGGEFASPHRNRAVDARAFFRGLELGLQYEVLDTGYGIEYAADRAQTTAVWARPDWSLYLRARHELSSQISSTSLVRYRRSDVRNDSYFVVSTPGTLPDGTPAQLVDLSYWQALSSSLSVFQDLDYKPSERLSFTAGFKYEQKDLQKAYDLSDGPQVPATELDASRYPYPSPPVATPVGQNHITTEDEGIYLHAKRRWNDRHQLHFGVRYDHNSRYGGATTFRGGYVGTYGRWGAKALYGEAFQEPTPRLLYGGWTGSGSDPNLEPQRSRTVEVSGSYKSPTFSALLSGYHVEDDATFITTAAGAENLGVRHVLGFDLQAQALLHPPHLRHLRLWGYYSRILKADEQAKDGSMFRIGDLADDQVLLGATAVAGDHFSATLRGRRVGARPTVASNPVGKVSGYTTVDATVIWRGLGVDAASLALKVTNLFGQEYFQPGVRDASAGVEPGGFDADGRWRGSAGFYNSLLPQPGRAALLTLSLGF